QASARTVRNAVASSSSATAGRHRDSQNRRATGGRSVFDRIRILRYRSKYMDGPAAADVELARAFERGDIRSADFRHESHLRVAWVYLRECSSVQDAAARMTEALQRFAASVGQTQKYHHTMTM